MKITSLKPLATIVLAIVLFGICVNKCSKTNTRDIQYENYCDSIWYCDRDYYLDVLAETDEYNDYIKEYGEWWNK